MIRCFVFGGGVGQMWRVDIPDDTRKPKRASIQTKLLKASHPPFHFSPPPFFEEKEKEKEMK